MKPKILIVDDNAMLRKTTRSILEANFSPLRIFEAVNGNDAFAQIRAQKPDLILMDIRLPGENGLMLTRKIKNLYPKIVVIIFTNHDLPEYRDAAFLNGADFFFSKSSPKNKLRMLVESLLPGVGLRQP